MGHIQEINMNIINTQFQYQSKQLDVTFTNLNIKNVKMIIFIMNDSYIGLRHEYYECTCII